MIPFAWLFEKRRKPARAWSSDALAFRAFLLGLDVYVVYGTDDRGPWSEYEEQIGLDPTIQRQIVGSLIGRMRNALTN